MKGYRLSLRGREHAFESGRSGDPSRGRHTERQPFWLSSPRPGAPTVALFVLISIAMFWIGALNGMGSGEQVSRADSTADLLAATAFVSGVDPYTDLYELSEQFGIEYKNVIGESEREFAIQHPRTPGSLVLMSPLTLLTSSQALYVMVIIGGAAVVASELWLGFRWALPAYLIIAALAFGLMSGPARWSFAFGSQSTIMWALVIVFGIAAAERKELATGLSLAVLGTLKLFPLLLLLLLWKKRLWRSIAFCVAIFVALNLSPLLLPHVSLEGISAAASTSITNWFELVGNISVAALVDRQYSLTGWMRFLIQLAIVLPAAVLILRRRLAMTWALTACLVAGVLVSPLSWPHYVLVVAPFGFAILSQARPAGWGLVVFVAGLLMTFAVEWPFLHTFGLSVMLVALLFGNRSRIDSPGDHLPSTKSPSIEGLPL